ncbi:unnamed protein product [Mytilus edulis]|uniref:Uncharacterized protein n=1 Tax=Mytilus edulis TaxID=6550 RepID=A0A8S3TCJ8_MYTED|nr:unnamed protein product [Mytilus edulis]
MNESVFANYDRLEVDVFNTAEESCLFIENNKSFELKCTNTTHACMKQKLSAKQQKRESHRFSNEVIGPESTKWLYVKVDDTTVAITPIYEKLDHVNGDRLYSSFQVSPISEENSNTCKFSLICSSLTKIANKRNSRMNWLCKVVKPVNDRTTESHGDTSIPFKDTNKESHGIPDYVFIVGGIVGVLVVTCIIAGVVLLRKRNCSEFRNTQMTSNDQVMPTVNSTYTPAWRSNKHESHHQAHLVNAPGGSNLSTTHAVYFDNRTDDKAIKLCPIQQPGIQANKHESNTYSHIRTTTDDSDDMYDHTVRNAVRNTCDDDYGVAHIRITEDDYNVSGTCHHPLTNKEDHVYT